MKLAAFFAILIVITMGGAYIEINFIGTSSVIKVLFVTITFVVGLVSATYLTSKIK